VWFSLGGYNERSGRRALAPGDAEALLVSTSSEGPARRVRRAAAVGLADATRTALAAAGRSATALPGLVAERVDPGILEDLADGLTPVVLVTGTNGKTTTVRLIARIVASTSGRAPVSNASGANLRQGVITALLRQRRAIGRRDGRNGPATTNDRPGAVLEVDELALPSVARDVHPDVLVMTNLFRDQLDRYGEMDRIVETWRAMLRSLPRTTRLVICAEDARLDDLASGSGLTTIRFGSEPSSADGVDDMASMVAAADPVSCRVCGEPLQFTWRTVAHLGDFSCSAGHVRRATPDILAVADGTAPRDPDDDAASARFRFHGGFGDADAGVGLAGVAGAYDSAAAIAAAMALGLDPRRAIQALDGASAAFGRLEHAEVDGRHVVLALVKNPASMAASARAALHGAPDGVLLALNDQPADGRDVSWIWDVGFDELGRVPVVGLTGTRADDLAVRLKYGDGSGVGRPAVAGVNADPGSALTDTLRRVRPGGTLVVLATYTALLAIRAILEHRGLVPPIPS
jgi:UDP-N-acetylmuramyl tripeptide synthase